MTEKYKKWDAEDFRKHLIKNRDNYQPIFWSGSSKNEFTGEIIRAVDRADTWEKLNPGWKSVGTLIKEAGYNPKKVDWEKASELFAQESGGIAHVFIGEKSDWQNNTWNTAERNAVINNDKIKEVFYHNLLTKEIGKFKDKKELPETQGKLKFTEKIGVMLTKEPSDKKTVKQIMRLQKAKDKIRTQLTKPKLTPERTRKLDQRLERKTQQHADKWDEVINSPRKDEIISKIQQAQIKELNRQQARDKTRDHDRTRE
ncbi:MAG: hypothetical protein LBH79_01365 [Nitrososphaerota archaeon]|jgi:hypothetical protein|nr:hypothetical protein [Nitrososphaerota archaeon]